MPGTAMIRAAGKGTRMMPLTASKPKPLIEVAGTTLLDHVLDLLRDAGIGRIVVNVHYLADQIEAHLAAHAGDFDVTISDEPVPAHVGKDGEVVRGQDLLLSTARQILLYQNLGFAIPRFYHCPLMTDETGVRLAKRHDSLSLREMRRRGMKPEDLAKNFGTLKPLVNFVANR